MAMATRGSRNQDENRRKDNGHRSPNPNKEINLESDRRK